MLILRKEFIRFMLVKIIDKKKVVYLIYLIEDILMKGDMVYRDIGRVREIYEDGEVVILEVGIVGRYYYFWSGKREEIIIK